MSDFDSARRFFLEGVRLLVANELSAAEAHFLASLKIIPDRASTLNNLATIKLKQNQFAEAEAFARRATLADEKSPEAWANLGMALVGLERWEEALPACERAFASAPPTSQIWQTKATVLVHLRRFTEAMTACQAAFELEPNRPELLHLQSVILQGLERPEEARKIYRQSLEISISAQPVFSAPRQPTQKATVLIVNNNPESDETLRSFEDIHLRCPNFPGQLVNYLLDDFHFTYVFAGKVTGLPDRAKIPPPDLVLNNFTNGQEILADHYLPKLTDFVESFGVPVINHPHDAVQTIRDTSVSLLKNLPDVIVPDTRRFSAEGKTPDALIQEIEAHFRYPMIPRPLASQRGIGMVKVDDRAALKQALTGSAFTQSFFVTQFIDSRGGNELYRKLRAAIVGQEILLMRADYDTFWNIHGRKNPKRVPFYLARPHLLEEEKRICLNPVAAIGETALQALHAIRKRIPLDVFGLDFDVAPDGRVVFYEANATMNLFPTASKQVPNPKETAENLKAALQRYFTTLLNRRSD